MRTHLPKRLAVHVLHRYVRSALVLADFVDRDDVGMVQGRCGARFLLEPAKPVGVRGHLLTQDFDGDISTELEIPGLVHFAHAAGAQLGEDFVVAEASARLEGHGQFVGTRRSSSSNQLTTTLNRDSGWSCAPVTIRKLSQSGDTSLILKQAPSRVRPDRHHPDLQQSAAPSRSVKVIIHPEGKMVPRYKEEA